MPGEVELKVYFQSSMSNIPTILVWGLVAAFITGLVVLLWKKGWRGGLGASSVLLLVEWVFLIFCTAVIFRESGESSRINLIPLSSYFDIAENSYLMEKVVINVLNVVMFIPVGLLLGIAKKADANVNPNLNEGGSKKGWLWVMAVGAGISVSIEFLQLILKRGLCEVDDVIHNVLGCVIGFVIAKLTLTIILTLTRKKK